MATVRPRWQRLWQPSRRGLAALGVPLVVAALAARTRRYQSQLERLTKEQARDVARTAALAELARRLSATEALGSIEQVVVSDGGAPLGAHRVLLAVEPSRLERAFVGGVGTEPAELEVGASNPLADALRSGAPVLVTDPADYLRRYSVSVDALHTQPVHQVLAVPLPASPEGTVRGALAFAWPDAVELDASDMDVAATIAELVAAALVRARSMVARTAQASAEARRVEVAAALSEEVTFAGVSEAALAALERSLGTSWAYVAVSEGAGADLRVTASRPSSAAVLGRPVRGQLGAASSVSVRPDDPILRQLARSGSIGRAEALVVAHGPADVMVVAGWIDGLVANGGLVEVADVVAHGMVRGMAFDREASTAAALQDALLTMGSSSSEVVYATRYRPAEPPMLVGGDWYDLVVDGDRIVVSVGDVVGQGLPAATVMGQLRSAVRTALLSSDDLVAALDVVDRFALEMGPSGFATVALAAIQPASGTASYCYAGHPPMLVVSGDGRVVFAEGARSWPIGTMPARRRPEDVGRLTLHPCEMLVLFTDGLFERRDEDLDVGLARLAAAVEARANLPTSLLCNALLDLPTEGGGVAGDDAVVLAVRRVGAVPGACFADVFPARFDALREARRRLGEWLASLPLASEAVDDVVLAASEAMANAVEHGSTNDSSAVVRVEAGRVGDELVVSVADTGQWRERPAGADDQRGRGLFLIERLVRSVDIEPSRFGTIVTLRLDLEVPGVPASARS